MSAPSEEGGAVLPLRRPVVPDEMVLWDKEQLAAYLGVSTSWVEKETAGGNLPHVLVGRSPRYVPREIWQWVLKQRREER